MQLDRLLRTILESAVEMAAFDAATVSARHPGGLTTIAATNERWIALDEAQYHADDGPCISVLERHDPILLDDISSEEAWPEFRTTAEHFGVTTSLSVHIPTEELEDVQASLNFYARDSANIKPDVAGRFADQLAIAMQAVEAHKVTAKLAAGLQQAMESRAVIEQAKGILIAQRGGSPDEAFERLREFSQHSNIKLRDVARRIVEEHAVRTRSKSDTEQLRR